MYFNVTEYTCNVHIIYNDTKKLFENRNDTRNYY